jgi:hypothetical protein
MLKEGFHAYAIQRFTEAIQLDRRRGIYYADRRCVQVGATEWRWNELIQVVGAYLVWRFATHDATRKLRKTPSAASGTILLTCKVSAFLSGFMRPSIADGVEWHYRLSALWYRNEAHEKVHGGPGGAAQRVPSESEPRAAHYCDG